MALAGLLHSVVKPLSIKDIPTIRPDDDSEDVGRISNDGYTYLYLPLQA